MLVSTTPGQVAERRRMFHKSELYRLIVEATSASLERALQLIEDGQVDVTLRGNRPSRRQGRQGSRSQKTEDDEETVQESESARSRGEADVDLRTIGVSDDNDDHDDDWNYLHLLVYRSVDVTGSLPVMCWWYNYNKVKVVS